MKNIQDLKVVLKKLKIGTPVGNKIIFELGGDEYHVLEDKIEKKYVSPFPNEEDGKYKVTFHEERNIANLIKKLELNNIKIKFDERMDEYYIDFWKEVFLQFDEKERPMEFYFGKPDLDSLIYIFEGIWRQGKEFEKIRYEKPIEYWETQTFGKEPQWSSEDISFMNMVRQDLGFVLWGEKNE